MSMPTLVQEGPKDVHQVALMRANWRIVPFLFMCYLANYIDRVNVAFAKLGFQETLHFSNEVYGLGLSLFFLGFILFEVPSNMLLARTGARYTISRIMIIWGLAATGLSMMQEPWHFYLGRFLLGVGEAGFVPGVLLYLSYWYPASYRARITSLFFIALPFSSIIGNPLSGGVMHTLGGVWGYENWRWLLFLEGAPAVLLAIVALFYLSDRPRNARWLSESHREALASAVEAEEKAKKSPPHVGFVQVLRDIHLYYFVFAVFTQFCVANVFAFWGPTILREAGIKGDLRLGLLNAIPFTVAAILMIAMARHSDKKMERRWHAAVGQFLTVAGLLLLPSGLSHATLAVIYLTVITSGHYIFWSIFFTIPPTYFRAGAAPVGIALITSIGALGGIFASNFLPWIKSSTGSFGLGAYSIAALAMLGAIVLLLGVRTESGS